MGLARDEAGHVWETDAQGHPVRLVQPAGQSGGQSGQVFSMPKDPTKEALTQANLGETNARTQQILHSISTQGQPSLPPGYRWKGGKVGGEAERVPGIDPNAGGTKISAQVRQAALAGYTSAQQLDDIIKDLETKFTNGPGATHGIKGLNDYNPLSTANQDFDNAGNAARGIVGQALGFTGGQLNTATEAAMAVGPYLPQAGDRDEVIRSKIARLKDLAQKARERAVAQLGGVPDANGNVTPVQPDQRSLATGNTRNVPDPKANALVTRLVRAGVSDSEINAALKDIGSDPVAPESLKAIREFERKNPGANYSGATRQEQTSALNRMAASPAGTFAGNAGIAGSAGLPMLLADQNGRDALQLANETNWKSALGGSVVGSMVPGVTVGKALGATRLAPWLAQQCRKGFSARGRCLWRRIRLQHGRRRAGGAWRGRRDHRRAGSARPWLGRGADRGPVHARRGRSERPIPERSWSRSNWRADAGRFLQER
jgi:hypothetical protein